MYKRRNLMIAIIIILIMLNSSADAQTFDDLVRSGYTAYSVNQLEEAKEILEELEMEYPDSHLGQIMQILVEIKEGDNEEAKRLLAEFDNSCDINSSSCDSPSVHVIAKTIQGKMFDSEATLRMADEMIGELSDELYRDCYATQIDIYLKKENPQKACDSCDEYVRISRGYLSSDIAMKCFIAYYSNFRHEDAKRVWRILSPIEKENLREIYRDLNF
jgi:tetratricopeptide (TPR) repeat protein